MTNLKRKLLGKLNIAVALVLTVVMTGALSGASYVLAASNSDFTQVINAGTLAVDIIDAASSSVASPTMAMSAVTFSFNCQASTGTFGTVSERIYISNPDAADGGWSVTMGATATSSVWDSAGTGFDFNDPTTGGCVDGGDDDSLGGQMTVDPSGATLEVGNCSSCATTNVTLGASNAFEQGTTDEITIVTGAAGSDDIGDWEVQGVSISQQIPAEQPAASDYSINMVLSIAAS